jgi:hypothetical protein
VLHIYIYIYDISHLRVKLVVNHLKQLHLKLLESKFLGLKNKMIIKYIQITIRRIILLKTKTNLNYI